MLIRHSFLYIVAKLLPGLFGLLTTAILTRLLDPQEYGLFGLAIVIMMLGSTIAFDWIGVSFLRFFQARRDDPRVIGTFIALFVALLALSAAALGIAWLGGLVPREQAPVYAVGLVMVWTYSWFELISRVAVAQFQPAKYLRMNLARSFLILIGATAAAWLTGSPVWVALGTAAGMAGGTCFAGLTIPRPSRRRFDPSLARAVLAFGAPIAASMALYSIATSGTGLLLEQLDSVPALGLYMAALVLVQNTLGVIAAGVGSAGYSLAVRAVESSDPGTARTQLLANGALLLAVLAPASLGMALTANAIATTLVGAKFAADVAPLIPWVAAATFFGCLRASYLDYAFQLGRRPLLQAWITGFAGIIAIGLAFALIPREGPIGAAIAVCAAASLSCIPAWLVGRYAHPIPLPIAASLRIFLCCAAMAVVIVLLPDRGWSGLVLRIGLGGATYIVAGFAVNLLGARERLRDLMRQHWRASPPAGAALDKADREPLSL
jgi:O-antigen/teichoic acid export membrane protein